MNSSDNRQSEVYRRLVKDRIESFEKKDALRFTCNVKTGRMKFTPFSVYLVGSNFYLDSEDVKELINYPIKRKSQFWSSDNHNLVSTSTLITVLSSDPAFSNMDMLSRIIEEVEKLKDRISWKQ